MFDIWVGSWFRRKGFRFFSPNPQTWPHHYQDSKDLDSGSLDMILSIFFAFLGTGLQGESRGYQKRHNQPNLLKTNQIQKSPTVLLSIIFQHFPECRSFADQGIDSGHY